jgi:ABC-type multidrug transport system fused ATPase/permease subunit
VRASGAEPRETERIRSRARSAYTASVRMAKLDAVMEPATDVAVNGSFLAVLLIGGVRVATGTRSVGDLVAFMLYMTYLALPVGSLFQAVRATQQGTGALQRINQVLALPGEPDTAPAGCAVPVREPTAGARQDNGSGPVVLEFRDVWFSYDQLRPVLRASRSRCRSWDTWR